MNKESGIGFCGLLAIVFITLKLCGVIAWSWWWVTCPLWIGLAAFLAIGAALFISWIVVMCYLTWFSSNKK